MKWNKNTTLKEIKSLPCMGGRRSKHTAFGYVDLTVSTSLFAWKVYTQYHKKLYKSNLTAFRSWAFSNYSVETTNHLCSFLNVFCRFLGQPDLHLQLQRPKKIHAVENIITEQQYKKLLQCLKADNRTADYWLVSWMAHTGGRSGDILSLTKACLETGYQDVNNKGCIRRLYIPKSLIAENRDFLEKGPGDHLFSNKKDINGNHIRAAMFNSQRF